MKKRIIFTFSTIIIGLLIWYFYEPINLYYMRSHTQYVEDKYKDIIKKTDEEINAANY